jgi:hypothetical protein
VKFIVRFADVPCLEHDTILRLLVPTLRHLQRSAGELRAKCVFECGSQVDIEKSGLNLATAAIYFLDPSVSVIGRRCRYLRRAADQK